MICLLRPVSQATLYIICFPRIVVVTYVNVDIHSTCLIMTPSCSKSLLLCAPYTNLSHLTTNLLLCVLFCVFPVCYDVHLSQLNKHYLFTYLPSCVKHALKNRINQITVPYRTTQLMHTYGTSSRLVIEIHKTQQRPYMTEMNCNDDRSTTNERTNFRHSPVSVVCRCL